LIYIWKYYLREKHKEENCQQKPRRRSNKAQPVSQNIRSVEGFKKRQFVTLIDKLFCGARTREIM
jgi:hypothetical protein